MIEDVLGAYWYAGAPGSGKTTRALRDAASLSARTGWPIVALDTVGAAQFDAIGRSGDLWDLARRVWGRGEAGAYWPKGEEDAERFFAVMWGGRRAHVVVDEAHYWASPYRILPGLSLLLRSFRHAEVSLHLTTQSFGDIPQGALAQAPRLYIFRNLAPRALERLEDYTGIEGSRIRALPRFTFLSWSGAFGAASEKPIDIIGSADLDSPGSKET